MPIGRRETSTAIATLDWRADPRRELRLCHIQYGRFGPVLSFERGPTKMSRQYSVLQLRVDFTVSLEEIVERRIGIIYKSFGTCAKPCLHGKATITFLVVTQETSSELRRRLEPALEQMGSVDNHWCHVAPTVAVGKRGGDPFVHWLGVAWDKAREWNKSEDVRQFKVFGRVSKREI
jgi:hypothetical protein